MNGWTGTGEGDGEEAGAVGVCDGGACAMVEAGIGGTCGGVKGGGGDCVGGGCEGWVVETSWIISSWASSPVLRENGRVIFSSNDFKTWPKIEISFSERFLILGLSCRYLVRARPISGPG